MTHKTHRVKVKMFFKSVILIGLLWIFSFPYMSRIVFTSENALNGRGMIPEFCKAGECYSNYMRIKEEVGNQYDDKDHRTRRTKVQKYILSQLGGKFEVH